MTIQLEEAVLPIEVFRHGSEVRGLGGGAVYFSAIHESRDDAMHDALEDLAWDELSVATD